MSLTRPTIIIFVSGVGETTYLQLAMMKSTVEMQVVTQLLAIRGTNLWPMFLQ